MRRHTPSALLLAGLLASVASAQSGPTFLIPTEEVGCVFALFDKDGDGKYNVTGESYDFFKMSWDSELRNICQDGTKFYMGDDDQERIWMVEDLNKDGDIDPATESFLFLDIKAKYNGNRPRNLTMGRDGWLVLSRSQARPVAGSATPPQRSTTARPSL